MTRRTFRVVLRTGLLLLAFGAAPFVSFAASLNLSPISQTVYVGQTFNVAVIVSSADQAMNAASGDISFPSGKLKVISILQGSSIITLWVKNPSFSNAGSSANINFAGIALNPGFTGNAGNIITIKFEAITAGQASLSFTDGSVLANDGNGTSILDSLGSASVTILPAPATQTAPPATSSPTSTTPTSTPPVATTTPHPPVPPYIPPQIIGFPWLVILALLILLLILLIIALAYYILRRHNFFVSAGRRKKNDREELHEDLKQIQDLRKKEEHLHKEIKRLEEDIEDDMKKGD